MGEEAFVKPGKGKLDHLPFETPRQGPAEPFLFPLTQISIVQLSLFEDYDFPE